MARGREWPAIARFGSPVFGDYEQVKRIDASSFRNHLTRPAFTQPVCEARFSNKFPIVTLSGNLFQNTFLTISF
jgi:hypothetical protein